MLATHSWVYLDLQKTGCTFLRDTLRSLFRPEAFVETKKHLPLAEASSLPTLITIRDPYSYYFSLWSYGMDGKGGFFKRVNEQDPEAAKRIYSFKSKECFSSFLEYTVLGSRGNHSNYPRPYWLPLGLDLYTMRILSMIVPIASREAVRQRLDSGLPSADDIITLAQEFMPTVLLRTTSLNGDFHQLAAQGDLDFMQLPSNWRDLFPLNRKPSNTSSLSSRIGMSPNATNDYWIESWEKAIKEASALSIWMTEKASRRLDISAQNTTSPPICSCK